MQNSLPHTLQVKSQFLSCHWCKFSPQEYPEIIWEKCEDKIPRRLTNAPPLSPELLRCTSPQGEHQELGLPLALGKPGLGALSYGPAHKILACGNTGWEWIRGSHIPEKCVMFTLNTAVETEGVVVHPNRGYQQWLAEFHLHHSPPTFLFFFFPAFILSN